ncbi:hypothetical protein QQF64_034163, partial [Cirrhinus molitorella]
MMKVLEGLLSLGLLAVFWCCSNAEQQDSNLFEKLDQEETFKSLQMENSKEVSHQKSDSALSYQKVLEKFRSQTEAERDQFLSGSFPVGFEWSISSESFKVEGGWAQDGKGETIWDRFSHEGHVSGNQTADLACDSYYKVDYDVYLLRGMKTPNYQVSISWARIFPTGRKESLLDKGVAYYDKMIDTLLQSGIEPTVTLHHWDLPQALQDLGRLGKRLYCEAFFKSEGNLGYGTGEHPPRVKDPIIASYKKSARWKVGIALNSDWAEPRNSLSDQDVAAAERYLNFKLGWFAHPIFVDGDYPAALKEQIEKKKDICGTELARLPVFTKAEKQKIQGTADFFGLNHHTSRLIRNGMPTEYNGDAFNDTDRVDYLKAYINEAMKAVNLDGISIQRFTVQSLMDGFEGPQGYSHRFGLHYVYFEANNIAPMVTLYHWDLPQALQDINGWDNPEMINIFNEYCDFSYATFGDRGCTTTPPWKKKSSCQAIHTYDEKYRASQGGLVSISLNAEWAEPLDVNAPREVVAADRALQFQLGWFAHPIFKNGDYPDAMKWQVGNKSELQGLTESRLPSFTDQDKAFIQGTADVFCISTYNTKVVRHVTSSLDIQSYETDQDVKKEDPDGAIHTAVIEQKAVAWGIRRLLNWLKEEYGDPEIYVTENGVATDIAITVDDTDRIFFLKTYVDEALKGKDYTVGYGLHYVNFQHPSRPRSPKRSAQLYFDIINNNGFPLTEDVAMLYGHFREGFKWSTASAAYQIEGAWRADGKGLSIWDKFAHTPEKISGDDNGDIACGSYYKIDEDINLLKILRVKNYRFTFHGPRIMPDGSNRKINQRWIKYIIGSRCTFGSQYHTTGLNDDPGVAPYVAGHNLIKAHAEAWHVYNDKYRATQGGIIGITINSDWAEPRNPYKQEDVDAAVRLVQFMIGWFAHPVFNGDYSDIMKNRIRERSLAAGRPQSRLPEFTPAEVARIKGTHDYFGLNHYATVLAFYVDFGTQEHYDAD